MRRKLWWLRLRDTARRTLLLGASLGVWWHGQSWGSLVLAAGVSGFALRILVKVAAFLLEVERYRSVGQVPPLALPEAVARELAANGIEPWYASVLEAVEHGLMAFFLAAGGYPIAAVLVLVMHQAVGRAARVLLREVRARHALHA